ncbi:MAG: hypothetical protein WC521_05955 [Bdellovibrionales bacterium]|jgi:cell division protein FtsL
MFSPDTPPPSKYRRTSSAPKKKGMDFSWINKILVGLFIIICTAAIAWIIVLSPAKKELVCNRAMQTSLSLISFGSCKFVQ